jgi:hypothetical protein
MTMLTGKVGFASPSIEKTISNRRTGIELIATLALAFSLVIAATAVSIGMARAQAFGAVGGSDSAPFALALLIGFVLIVMGGLTAIMARQRPARRD